MNTLSGSTARPNEDWTSRDGNGTTGAEQVLGVDTSEFPEADWREKIAKAKEAGKAGREARKGKPIGFGRGRSRRG